MRACGMETVSTSDKESFPRKRSRASRSGVTMVSSEIQQACQKLIKTVAEALQKTEGLPSSTSEFTLMNSYSSFADRLASLKVSCLKDISSINNHFGIPCKWPTMMDLRSLDTSISQYLDHMEILVDSNDVLFERADLAMDEALGLNRHSKSLIRHNPSSDIMNFSIETSSDMKKRVYASRRIERPQLKWNKKIDNSYVNKFYPQLDTKPHAKIPLECFPKMFGTKSGDYVVIPEEIKNQIDSSLEATLNRGHYYAYEIQSYVPSKSLLHKSMLKVPDILEIAAQKQKPILIDDLANLERLIETLQREELIAVDLEAHSYRSYMGYVCLMQISTIHEDYLVDTLNLRESLYRMNSVFADPRILKIMHGAKSDILWMQRDFSLFVVNMFDTFIASNNLHNVSKHSLLGLVKQFLDISLDKTHQLSDWRIRPLPADMVEYARNDTRYLIPLYYCLKNQILSSNNGRNSLISIHKSSNDICLSTFSKPLFDPEGYRDILTKYGSLSSSAQLLCFKYLYEWRDDIARTEDESCLYVLPNHSMYSIAHDLPSDPAGIFSCCNPVPPLLRQHVMVISSIISSALEEGSNEPDPYITREPTCKDDARLLDLQQSLPVQLSDNLGIKYVPQDLPKTKISTNNDFIQSCTVSINRVHESVTSAQILCIKQAIISELSKFVVFENLRVTEVADIKKVSERWKRKIKSTSDHHPSPKKLKLSVEKPVVVLETDSVKPLESITQSLDLNDDQIERLQSSNDSTIINKPLSDDVIQNVFVEPSQQTKTNKKKSRKRKLKPSPSQEGSKIFRFSEVNQLPDAYSSSSLKDFSATKGMSNIIENNYSKIKRRKKK